MKRYLALAFCTFTLSLLLAVSPGETRATADVSAASTTQTDAPSGVTVGIWIVSVQEIDLPNTSYTLDFYLWFICSPPVNETCSKYVNYDFINAASLLSVSLTEDTPAYSEYRIRGTFLADMSFTYFPLESHTLAVQIESKTLNVEHLNFVTDPSSTIGPDATVAGWQLDKSLSADVVDYTYPGGGKYSRAIFTINIARYILQSFLKSILPIVIITAIGMLAFLIPPERSFERMFAGVTTLLGVITIHSGLLDQIAPVGYLTLIDKIGITAYALFLYSIGVTVWLMRIVARNDVDRARRINTKAGILVPIAVIIFLSFLLLAD